MHLAKVWVINYRYRVRKACHRCVCVIGAVKLGFPGINLGVGTISGYNS